MANESDAALSEKRMFGDQEHGLHMESGWNSLCDCVKRFGVAGLRRVSPPPPGQHLFGEITNNSEQIVL